MNENISHLTSLFENATEGIILTNGRGNIVLVNPAAEKMFGFEAGEIIDQAIEVLIPDNVKPHHRSLRNGFYEHPSNRVMGKGRDLFGKRKDGSNIPVEVSLSFYERDEELFVIAFIVDITERKKIEQNMLDQQRQLKKLANEMRKMNLELETKVEERTLILKDALRKLEESQKDLSEALDKEKQLSEIKSRFVSIASHEFRTPLSTVLSSASLLSKYKTTDEQDKRDRHVEKIKNSVKHLNTILEDFLSLGKLNEGKIAAQTSKFNIEELLNEIVDEMKVLMKKNQTMHSEHSGTSNLVSDKKLVKNVLINLSTNAIKFSGEGKPILIKSNADSEMLQISVMDEGIGISQEDQGHLFSSFYRGKNAANIEGTGLGLHIVKKYLELLGGEIEVMSDIGKGTTFSVRIPLIHSDEL